MKQDDGVRSLNGVIASLRAENNGLTFLVFDDATCDTPTRPASWKPGALFTLNGYDSEKLKGLMLNEEQYAEIGKNLILRLLVLNGELNK